MAHILVTALLAAFGAFASAAPNAHLGKRANATFVNQETCNGKTYTYENLAGYGFLPSDSRDKYGDTIGGIGSSMALDRSAWKKTGDGQYTGILWGLPDRGWNTEGTTNFHPRVHKFTVSLTLAPNATVSNPSKPNVALKYLDTILFTAPDGVTLCTGLDADATGFISYPGFPDLPVATFTGDGWGGPGNGGKAIPIDSEGLVLNSDGSFWVSDEYGPYVYLFDPTGKMIKAIRPNDAILPRRNGTVSFSANSPPLLDPKRVVIPGDPSSGRNNNQGFEGLTITGDGRNLYVLLQSALNQEGGPAKQTNRYARLVKYDISSGTPRYAREFVVPLPQWTDPTSSPAKALKTAAQSEIFHIQDGQFFILARDSGSGHGQPISTSIYRHIDVFDIASATDIKGGTYDGPTSAIASSAGVLKAGITPATYCPFIDFNLNSQLNRFGVHNGGPQDQFLLNEKWESIGLVPVDGKIGDDDEWFIFSLSDNDFVTQNGFQNFGMYPYHDASGYNLDNQILVFQIKLPEHSRPFDRDNGGT